MVFATLETNGVSVWGARRCWLDLLGFLEGFYLDEGRNAGNRGNVSRCLLYKWRRAGGGVRARCIPLFTWELRDRCFAVSRWRVCTEYKLPIYLLRCFGGISQVVCMVVSRRVRWANMASTANVYVCSSFFVYLSVESQTHDGLFSFLVACLESHSVLGLVLLLVPRKLAHPLSVVSDKSSDNVSVVKSIRVP